MSNGKEVETINPFPVEVVKRAKVRGTAFTAVGGQPSAAEISQLTFMKLRDVRIDTQELRNQFARLLNRGSSLE
jgi:hypothetical protein